MLTKKLKESYRLDFVEENTKVKVIVKGSSAKVWQLRKAMAD